MLLPNYFLADLPPEAKLSPVMVGEAAQSLKRNREQYLLHRGTSEIIECLSSIAEEWLDPNYPLRQMALALGPPATGFSQPTLAAGLDSFFQQLTADNLHLLVTQELGHPQRLDSLVSSQEEMPLRQSAMTSGHELLVHIAAGNIPVPTLMSMVLGLLARSAQFIKCASGASLLPRLFAHSLYQVEPKLGSCLELAEWPGGNEELENTLFAAADCVTATGRDETLAKIRLRLPSQTRFLGYGQRVSFGYLAHDSLSRQQTPQVVGRAVTDIVAWNQLGCLSPHLFYVEKGGSVSPEQFAEKLAAELAQREQTEPRGELPVETAAEINRQRSFYQVRAAYSPETRLWCSPDSTAWTVVFEQNATFQVSCLHRFVFIKPVRDLEDALYHAANVRGQVSTVGLAAPLSRTRELATHLARWGATRICPLGQMQRPPLTWRHDGRPSLGELVRWANWEQ